MSSNFQTENHRPTRAWAQAKLPFEDTVEINNCRFWLKSIRIILQKSQGVRLFTSQGKREWCRRSWQSDDVRPKKSTTHTKGLDLLTKVKIFPAVNCHMSRAITLLSCEDMWMSGVVGGPLRILSTGTSGFWWRKKSPTQRNTYRSRSFGIDLLLDGHVTFLTFGVLHRCISFGHV